MKSLFYISLSVGAILILLAVLFKEMGWDGRRELRISGICVLLFAMLLFLYSTVIKKKKITD